MPTPSPTRSRRTCLAAATAAIALALALGACASRNAGSSTSSAATRPAAEALSPERRQQYLESFDVTWQTVQDSHFDPNLNGADWEGARAELRPKVDSAQTVGEARGVLNELLSRLNQTHFGIIPREAYSAITPSPSSSSSDPAQPAPGAAPSDSTLSQSSSPDAPAAAESAGSDSTPGVLGAHVRIVDDAALIVRVQPDSDAARSGVRPGWIITSIHGRPVSELLTAAQSGTSHAGSPSLARAMASRAIESRLTGAIGSSVSVTFLDEHDQHRTLTLKRVAAAGEPATIANLPVMFVEFESRRVQPRVGYIRLSVFLDPPRINPLFTSAIREFLDDTDGLILDLRGNPGGLGIMAIGLGGHFVSESGLKLGTMKTRQTELKFVLNPRAKPYTRPLAILVDESSLSTSEILAGGLQDLARARVFGSRTGGAALPSVIKPLPSGDALQYAMADYVSAAGRPLEGVGILPDQPVEPDRRSLLDGRDPVIDAAVQWIQSQPIR